MGIFSEWRRLVEYAALFAGLLNGVPAGAAPTILWLKSGCRLQGHIAPELANSGPGEAYLQRSDGSEIHFLRDQIVQAFVPGQGLWIPGLEIPPLQLNNDAVLVLKDGNRLVGEPVDFPEPRHLDSALQITRDGLKHRKTWRFRPYTGGDAASVVEVPATDVQLFYLGVHIQKIDLSGLALGSPARVDKVPTWFPEFGVLTSPPLPLTLLAGLHRDQWGVRVAGFGHAQEGRNRYAGVRLDMGWEWIHSPWLALETSVYSAWWYREQVDSLAVVVNSVLQGHFLYENDIERWARSGVAFSTYLDGLHAGLALPLWQWGEVRRRWEWQLGLRWRFWP